ncbi:flagellum-associated coiled-coil domain-containing protein 1 isoform X3 [Cavia porcellus]|uniref:flagellum-associated coiled-coil domain-containing protein 1 isoform X3 n=1 Tax=Cavia porcellus TaxID=10141 RepID=UPI000C876E3A|nr:amyotrophic lateral sclerosis 2 chromosomal region candidate gene 12 protein isoform X2 [Cavia porcellus]
MYRNPLIYCTCWDPWGLGPRKLIRTPQPPPKASWRRSKLTPLLPVSKEHNYLQPLPATKPTVAPKLGIHPGRCKETQKSPQEVIDVSPGYQLVRSREQVSVTLGDEMFNGEKQLEPEVTDRVSSPRASIICDLEEQISELTTIIEQMNRDHQAARKLLCGEMERRCDAMKRSFDCKTRTPFTMKWKTSGLSGRQSGKRVRSRSGRGSCFNKELLKQHERDTMELQELRKNKEIIEEELHAQALILESLNTSLYQTQLELQKEKAVAGNLEKVLQNKLAEAEEKYKHIIQDLTAENSDLRQKIIAKNEDSHERRPERSTSVALSGYDLGMLEDSSNKRGQS